VQAGAEIFPGVVRRRVTCYLPFMKHFQLSDWPTLAAGLRRPYQSSYFAMYSSVFGGIVTDPILMMLPIDDHMVHRGDGIFEAVKAVDGRIYNLRTHLDRLAHSARGLALPLPASFDQVQDIVIATVRAGRQPDVMIRIFVSRGPGGFAVNPYECPASQLYVVVTALGKPFMQLHPEGASVQTSAIQAKSAVMANIKNCNYAPNVLMKKEAVDAGLDYTAGFDENGFLTEGATENMGIVSRDNRLLFPRLDRILAGTTMLRLMALAGDLVAAGTLAGVGFADISHDDILNAREFLIAGTTINVAAAVRFDGHPIADGRPGPVYRDLSLRLEKDIRENASLLTPAL
jgi:branched-subunit amino acid aminotransferase/4-amino-4-deoxychorismate lyase